MIINRIFSIIELGVSIAKLAKAHRKLKRRGFVIEIGLHPLVSETASQCFGMPSPTLGTQPTDVPYAITGVKKRVLVL